MNEHRASPFEKNLDKNAANHIPLTPIAFLRRTAEIFPERLAVVHGSRRYTYAEFARRVALLAGALQRRGVRSGDVVSIMAPNTPAMLEAHYAVAGIGAVLNPLNVRLDATALSFILDHGGCSVLLSDREYSATIERALAQMSNPPWVVDIDDLGNAGGYRIGVVEYEDLLCESAFMPELQTPADEWDAFLLSYTSGTTGDPKGVVYHHRGAYLNTVMNVAAWSLPSHPVMLWTLPIFHSLGWCFPWTITLMAGTHVCLRKIDAAEIYRLIADEGVTHMCGAPIVLNTLCNARSDEVQPFSQTVRVMTAASAPPPSVIETIEQRGFDVLHVYGMTEVFGPSSISVWKPEWDALPSTRRAKLKSRQGVAYPSVNELAVLDPETMEPVPRDGVTLGEVMNRSNTVMRGYLKNSSATERAFAGGWFHTGDLAVMHPDGYIELKDRSKDIIISGGENISTIEVEAVLYAHPAVLEAAVVGRPDEKWGETPCAFVALRSDASASEAELIGWCREQLAHFKAPKSVIFGELPKTSTGKVQKFILRARLKELVGS
jgi:fatty-acyl-CoA synthase